MTLTTLEGPAELGKIKLSIGPWAARDKAKKIQKQAQMIAAAGAVTGNQSLVMLGAARYMQGRNKVKKANKQIKTVGNVAKVGALVVGGVLAAPLIAGAAGIGAAGAGAAGAGAAGAGAAGAGAAGIGAAGAGAAGAGAAGIGAAGAGSTGLLASIGSGISSMASSALTGGLLSTVAGKAIDLFTGAGQQVADSAMSAVDAYSAQVQQQVGQYIQDQTAQIMPQQQAQADANSTLLQWQQAQIQQLQNQQSGYDQDQVSNRNVVIDDSSTAWYQSPVVLLSAAGAAVAIIFLRSKSGGRK